MRHRSPRPWPFVLISALLGAGPSARAQTPPPETGSAVAAVGRQLDSLQALARPLERDYALKDRKEIAPALKELCAQLKALETRAAPDKAAAVQSLDRAAAETARLEDAFEAANAGAAAQSLSATTSEPLRARLRRLVEQYDALFPQASAQGARGASAVAAARARLRAVGSGATVDSARFFDQSGSRSAFVEPTPASGAGARRSPPPASYARGSNASGWLSLHTADVPSPASHAPAPSAPPPANAAPSPESACAAALKGQETFVGMCRTSPTLAPLLAGLVESLREQFGTAQGLVTNLAFMLLGLLMAAVSGFGLVAKAVVGLASFAMLAGTLYSLLKQGIGAGIDIARTDAADVKHAAALKSMGKVGGTVLILALMSALGFGIGKTKMGANAMEGMTSMMGKTLGKLGIAKGAAGLDALLPASVKAVLSQLFPPDGASKKKAEDKPQPKPEQKPLNRSAKSRERFSDDQVLQNAAIKDPKARASAARTQLGADDAAASAIADAHDKVPCPVGGCSNAQLKAKLRIMKDVPPEIRDNAIRSGLAGELPPAHPGEPTFLGMSHADISFMEVFEPEKFAALAEEHPEVKIIASDEKFRPLDGLSRDAADRRISQMYPDDYMQGYHDWNQYLNRKRWREQSGGRPIPGDPGGPPLSEVDKAMGSPHLPPKGVKGVVVPGQAVGPVTLFSEVPGKDAFSMGEINAYAPDLKRVGSLPYTIQADGHGLSIGHMFVEPAARSQVVGGARVPGIGTPMIAQMIAANPHAVKVKAVLFEDNGQAFYEVFAKTHDYFTALRNTPLYRALARQGFTEITPPGHGWEESPFIPFEVHRPTRD